MGAFAKRTITKTRRKTRDLDQIHADLQSPKHLKQFQELKAAEDLPGLGKHYCIECAKYFESENSMTSHLKGKPHKRRYVIVIALFCHYIMSGQPRSGC